MRKLTKTWAIKELHYTSQTCSLLSLAHSFFQKRLLLSERMTKGIQLHGSPELYCHGVRVNWWTDDIISTQLLSTKSIRDIKKVERESVMFHIL